MKKTHQVSFREYNLNEMKIKSEIFALGRVLTLHYLSLKSKIFAYCVFEM